MYQGYQHGRPLDGCRQIERGAAAFHVGAAKFSPAEQAAYLKAQRGAQ